MSENHGRIENGLISETLGGIDGSSNQAAWAKLELCSRELSESLRTQDELVNSPPSDESSFDKAWRLCDARLKRAVIALAETPARSLTDLSRKIDLYAAWTDTVEIEDALAARLSLTLILECREHLRSHLQSETPSSQTRRAPFASPSAPSRLNFTFSELFAGSRRSGSRRSQV